MDLFDNLKDSLFFIKIRVCKERGGEEEVYPHQVQINYGKQFKST